MKKKLLSIFTVLCFLALSIALIACQDYVDDPGDGTQDSKPTYTHTITNGTFYDAKTTATKESGNMVILDDVEGWSIGSGSTTNYATAKNGVFSAAVDVSADTFSQFANEYFVIDTDKDGNQLANPVKFGTLPGLAPHIPQVDKLDKDGKVIYDENNNAVKQNEDSNVLALVSTENAGSIYMSTEKKATLKSNKVYLFQFSVCTLIESNESNEKGAWVILTGDIDYKVKCIDTKGVWKTYYFFIETNSKSEYSIGVQLWLGYGPAAKESDDKGRYATRGVALFDNVLCEEVDREELTSAITETNLATYGAYEYNEEAMEHDDFVSFKAALNSTKDTAGNAYVKATSVYYLKNQTMELRSALTGYTTDSNRPYFYSFREKYTESNLVGWAKNSGSTSVNARYYGSVDLSKLYTETTETDVSKIKDNYKTLLTSSYQKYLYFMNYTDWKDGVMNDEEHKIAGSEDTYAMMLYNTNLQANNIYSSEKISIKPNTYYEVSAWAYVWAHDYDDTAAVKYVPEYSDTVEPADPRDFADTANSSRFSEINARIYSLYEKATAGEFTESDAFYGYFNELTSEGENNEKSLAEAFDEAQMGEFKYSGTQSATYKALAKTWLAGIFGIQESEVKDDLVQVFYYTYLEKNFDALAEDSKNALTAVRAEITKGYYNERLTHYNTINKAGGLKEKVEDYLDKKEEYDEKKSNYDSAYETWTDSGNEKPVATLILSGVGDDIEASTTADDFMQWTKITLRVRGNQLSSRDLTLKMALGTGDDNSTYMVGGVFFDNVEIKAYETNPNPEENWVALSQIKSTDEIAFGGLYGTGSITENKKNEISREWEAEVADGTADADASQVEVSASDYGDAIKISDADYNLYAVNYTNKVATASSLSYKGKPIKILKNKFYRLAVSVKTSDFTEDSAGVTLKLVYGEDENDLKTDVSKGSVTGYTAKEWQEVVFYIQGDLLKDYYITISATMGDGNRFSTDKYVSGTLSLAAFNCLEIDYTEYKDAATGDKKVSGLSLYSISYTTGDDSANLTNSYYSKLNYSSTNKTEFAEDGKLTGIGVTSDWTSGVIDNKYNVPTNIELDTINNKLSWKKASGYTSNDSGSIKKGEAVAYEIWMKYTFDGKDEEKLYRTYAVTDLTEVDNEYEVEISGASDWAPTSFALKTIGIDGVSDLSSYTVSKLGKANGTEPVQVTTDAYEAKAGTVLAEPIFAGVNVDGENYVSPYPTVLKMTTDYKAIVNITSASESLTANSYYKISVWAKTSAGTYASITLTDTSGSLQANTNSDELGFVKVTTNDQWNEYCFYIKTGNFSPSMKVRFSLGNPYAKSKSQKLDGDSSNTSFYNVNDFCKEGGVAYFDAVKIVTVTEEEFADAKTADESKLTDERYASKNHEITYTALPYYIYVMEYVIDSFDATDAPASGSEKELGNTPENYKHAIDADLKSDNTAAVYGVYDVNSNSEDMQAAVKYLYTYAEEADDEEEIIYAYNKIVELFPNLRTKYIDTDEKWGEEEWNNFMKDFLSIKDESGYEGGSNVLVMSNKAESGFAQNYALSSSYNYKVAAGTYHKLTFTARTLIADVTTKEVVEDGETVKQYNYNVDKTYAKLNILPTGSADDEINVKINSYEYGTKEGIFDAVTYTVYFYNPTETENTTTWTFYLGDEEDADNPEDELMGYVIGLMAVDLVSISEIDEIEYEAGIATSTSDKTVYKYEYEAEEDDDKDEEDDDHDHDHEEEEESFWDRLFNNEYFWLYISSFVIAVVIVITVVVVIVNRWKKKHPKEVIVDNIVKTEKDIKIVPTVSKEKEEALESDAYVDEIKPVYRPTDHQKKKNKNNKKR